MAGVSISEFATALEIGKAKAGNELTENPLLEIVQTFCVDRRYEHFLEDLRTAMQERRDTLNDVHKLRMAAAELGLMIQVFSGLQKEMLSSAETIIEMKRQAGILQEGLFRIQSTPITRNRIPNIALIQKEHPDAWDRMLTKKKKEVESSFSPTQAYLKEEFKESFEKFLLPGPVIGISYDIVPVAPIQEKNPGVEP